MKLKTTVWTIEKGVDGDSAIDLLSNGQQTRCIHNKTFACSSRCPHFSIAVQSALPFHSFVILTCSGIDVTRPLEEE